MDYHNLTGQEKMEGNNMWEKTTTQESSAVEKKREKIIFPQDRDDEVDPETYGEKGEDREDDNKDIE